MIQNLNLPPSKLRIYALLIGITLATAPCYCVGLIAIQGAPDSENSTPTTTPDLPLMTQTEQPDQSPTATASQTTTPTSTSTRFVPPSPTEFSDGADVQVSLLLCGRGVVAWLGERDRSPFPRAGITPRGSCPASPSRSWY